MAVKRSTAENLPRILQSIAAAGAAGAHFLLLPECALSGYHGEFDQADIESGLDAIVQALKALGAQVIFHAVNSGFEQSYLKWHTAHLETYARLFDVTIVTANAGGDEPSNCPTGTLDASGQWIAQLDRVGEGLLFATIEIAEA